MIEGFDIMKQTKGKCHFCNKEYTKAGMLRHFATCSSRIEPNASKVSTKQSGSFILNITDKYDKAYWLIVACKEETMLKDLDKFLRDIWLECCGHLSSFNIAGTSFDSSTGGGMMGFWGEPPKSMNHSLKKVLEKGLKIGYEYDFGSTTDLIITVSDYCLEHLGKDKITLISRNNPVEHTCSECGTKVAKMICGACSYTGNGYVCDKCEEVHECDDFALLPICNSPRCGVCGYTGSTIYGD